MKKFLLIVLIAAGTYSCGEPVSKGSEEQKAGWVEVRSSGYTEITRG